MCPELGFDCRMARRRGSATRIPLPWHRHWNRWAGLDVASRRGGRFGEAPDQDYTEGTSTEIVARAKNTLRPAPASLTRMPPLRDRLGDDDSAV